MRVCFNLLFLFASDDFFHYFDSFRFTCCHKFSFFCILFVFIHFSLSHTVTLAHILFSQRAIVCFIFHLFVWLVSPDRDKTAYANCVSVSIHFELGITCFMVLQSIDYVQQHSEFLSDLLLCVIYFFLFLSFVLTLFCLVIVVVIFMFLHEIDKTIFSVSRSLSCVVSLSKRTMNDVKEQNCFWYVLLTVRELMIASQQFCVLYLPCWERYSLCNVEGKRGESKIHNREQQNKKEKKKEKTYIKYRNDWQWS